MKRNPYFRYVFGRENPFQVFIHHLFITISSYPNLLLEAFLRKNMGERYFRFSVAIIVAVFLGAAPYYFSMIGHYGRLSMGDVFAEYWSWYLFIGAFLFFAVKRRKEIKSLPSAYDFQRCSVSMGEFLPLFRNMKVHGVETTSKFIETVLEPGAFFIAGLLLFILGQKVGILLMVCGIIYAASHAALYRAADNFILNKIDEMIANEEMRNAFVDNKSINETRGFRAIGRKPADTAMREKICDAMLEEPETFTVE